jgi:hypothetical protein
MISRRTYAGKDGKLQGLSNNRVGRCFFTHAETTGIKPTYTFGSPNNSPPLPRAKPTQSSGRQLPVVPASVTETNQKPRITHPQFRRRWCSACNLSPHVWIARWFSARAFPSCGLALRVALYTPKNHLHEPRSRHTVRAGSICRVPLRVYPGGSSRPILFSDHLHCQLSLARAVVEIHIDDLLPGAQC